MGAEEERLPRAPTRALQGLMVGLVVTAGFLTVFAAVGIPISYGATQITRAVPWAGIVIGAVMALAGILILTGRRVSLPLRSPIGVRRERRAGPMFLFGMAYAVASLGCTLPVFLALVGASLATRGPGASLVVFGAYGFGMAVVLMALSLGAALLRNGIARALKRVVPHMNRIAGGLLVVAGIYLSYYWSRVLFAPVGSLYDDPLVGSVQRFTTWVQGFANSGGGRWLIFLAGTIVVVVATVALWRWTGTEGGGPEQGDRTLDDERVRAASTQ